MRNKGGRAAKRVEQNARQAAREAYDKKKKKKNKKKDFRREKERKGLTVVFKASLTNESIGFIGERAHFCIEKKRGYKKKRSVPGDNKKKKKTNERTKNFGKRTLCTFNVL